MDPPDKFYESEYGKEKPSRGAKRRRSLSQVTISYLRNFLFSSSDPDLKSTQTPLPTTSKTPLGAPKRKRRKLASPPTPSTTIPISSRTRNSSLSTPSFITSASPTTSRQHKSQQQENGKNGYNLRSVPSYSSFQDLEKEEKLESFVDQEEQDDDDDDDDEEEEEDLQRVKARLAAPVPPPATSGRRRSAVRRGTAISSRRLVHARRKKRNQRKRRSSLFWELLSPVFWLFQGTNSKNSFLLENSSTSYDPDAGSSTENEGEYSSMEDSDFGADDEEEGDSASSFEDLELVDDEEDQDQDGDMKSHRYTMNKKRSLATTTANFDSWSFIQSLGQPPAPTVWKLPGIESNRPMLVLDLDETLVHASCEPITNPDLNFAISCNGIDYSIYVLIRPFVREFLKSVSSWFQVAVFTASQDIYANRVLDLIDPNQSIQYRLFREHCLYVNGVYIKDLRSFGRPLSRIVMIDNTPHAFGYQIDNGIPIESWYHDRNDTELKDMLPFLKQLSRARDVRTLIRKEYKTHEKVKTWPQIAGPED